MLGFDFKGDKNDPRRIFAGEGLRPGSPHWLGLAMLHICRRMESMIGALLLWLILTICIGT